MLKIYKIVDNTNGNVYIGKTKQKYLCDRLSSHKYDKTCMSREIIKNRDYKIELIEETEDETRERYWIENTECINKNIPGRTKKEWNENNKDKMIAYRKKYYKNKNNRDKFTQYQKEYDKIKNKWYTSMGGNPYSNNNSLIKIDPNLFI
jgi:hypothetical protein